MATFKKIRAVTQTVLKLEKTKPRFVFITGPMYLGEKLPNSTMEAATLMPCVDMESGEVGVVLAPAILQKELNKHYPGESYVNRGFEITTTRNAEKKYNHVSISEVSVPDEVMAMVAQARKDAAEAEAHSAQQRAQVEAGTDATAGTAATAAKPKK
jgi:hypothetical protein